MRDASRTPSEILAQILAETFAQARRIVPRAAIAALLLAGTCALGGCASGGAANNAYAMAASTGSGPTVAFDTIDGPPPQVFDRMVSVLDSESKMRSLAIVSREGQAAYRVRFYLAAEVVRGRAMIAWVWDVYDRDQQRALRLSGEEPGAKAGRDAWAAADDMVLRKIAQAGLSGLSGMINGTPDDAAPVPAGPEPARRGPAVASANGSGSDAQDRGTSDALGFASR
jgi:hypothetical protein